MFKAWLVKPALLHSVQALSLPPASQLIVLCLFLKSNNSYTPLISWTTMPESLCSVSDSSYLPTATLLHSHYGLLKFSYSRYLSNFGSQLHNDQTIWMCLMSNISMCRNKLLFLSSRIWMASVVVLLFRFMRIAGCSRYSRECWQPAFPCLPTTRFM